MTKDLLIKILNKSIKDNSPTCDWYTPDLEITSEEKEAFIKWAVKMFEITHTDCCKCGTTFPWGESYCPKCGHCQICGCCGPCADPKCEEEHT